MTKNIIPNMPGHYEFPGVEIDIFDKQIIIRTYHQQGDRNWKKNQNHDQQKRDQPPQKRGDDGNMSIFSSIQKIRDKFVERK